MLACVFFAGQAFSCCNVNQRIGHLLLSAFTAKSAAVSHSCCAKAVSASRPDAPAGCENKACCIRDAGKRVPQLVSVPAQVPDLSGLALALLPDPASLPVTSLLPPAGKADSGPPVWLRTLRLLV